MNQTTKPAFGETFETFLPANKKDGKGRPLGFFVTLVDNGIEFRASVQKGIVVDGEPKTWGASQPSKKFGTQKEATDYAYATAKARIAKL